MLEIVSNITEISAMKLSMIDFTTEPLTKKPERASSGKANAKIGREPPITLNHIPFQKVIASGVPI